jgi:hypothetical protein
MHSHGAVQTGYAPTDIACVLATTPTATALTVPHMTATIPRIITILIYRFPIISHHHSSTIPGRVPGLHDGDSGEPLIYVLI